MNIGDTELKPWLVVIGYGNDLRGDDGAGRLVARAVEARNLPGVLVLDSHQLVPEMADEIASAELVLFVDASVNQDLSDFRVLPLASVESKVELGHCADPNWLLTLTRRLYGRMPAARLLTIAAPCLDFGEHLSPLCQHAVAEAVLYIESVARDYPSRARSAAACAAR